MYILDKLYKIIILIQGVRIPDALVSHAVGVTVTPHYHGSRRGRASCRAGGRLSNRRDRDGPSHTVTVYCDGREIIFKPEFTQPGPFESLARARPG